MKLSTGPEFFEAIANDPSVFPYVTRKGVYEVRLGAIWDRCLGFEFDTGGWVLVEQAPRVFEVHTLFLPKSQDVIERGRLVLAHMFPALADELVTMVPVDLPHAKRLALRLGFSFVKRVPKEWERDSGPVDMDHFRLTCRDHMERVQCLS